MRRFISEEDVEESVAFLLEAGPAAKARSERLYLEGYTKSLVAQIMSEYPGLPVNAQEREAWKDFRLLRHQEAVKIAIFEDEKHRNLREAHKARIEVWRSQGANERAIQL